MGDLINAVIAKVNAPITESAVWMEGVRNMEDRIKALVATFNGAIKYGQLLKDHPDWSDEQCLAFAREGHAKAVAQLKSAMARDKAGEGHWHNQVPVWNDRIPYCRNQPTLTMIEEAMK